MAAVIHTNAQLQNLQNLQGTKALRLRGAVSEGTKAVTKLTFCNLAYSTT
uniref:Uncharacterized protein n=1 Tax=Aegilops tauschii TaxID=37682 RepID=M8AYZ3_AEGTA